MKIEVHDLGGTVFADGRIILMIFSITHKETRLYLPTGQRFKMMHVNNQNLYRLMFTPF
jgi:hypothetical protein